MFKGQPSGEVDVDGVESFRFISLGLDIGSSTSHMALSRLTFRRQGARLSTRFEVIDRAMLYRSPIVLTPYKSADLIDTQALDDHINGFFVEAGIDRARVDTGLVVITGEALRKANSRAITTWFSRQIGPFTCVSAGAHHEALLAAHGSGAVGRSRRDASIVVCIDVGGGTTKIAVIREGVVVGTMAFKVGGRLLSFTDSAITRIEPSAVRLLAELDHAAALGTSVSPGTRKALGDVMAKVTMEFLSGGALSSLAKDLTLTGLAPIPPLEDVDSFIFSGGVSEYVYGRSDQDYGDLGKPLGLALRSRFEQDGLWPRVIEPTECIRATVVGAGEYTVQASGMTSFVSDYSVLPAFGLEVLQATASAAEPKKLQDMLRRALRDRDLDLLTDGVVVAISLDSVPTYPYVRSVAESILSVAADGMAASTLFIVVKEDLAHSLGSLLKNELGWPGTIVVIDCVVVGDLDYLDIGHPASAAAAIPLTVKSLFFPDELSDTGGSLI